MEGEPLELELGQDLHRFSAQLPVFLLGADAERRRDPVDLRARGGTDHDVVEDRHRRVEGKVLERARDPATGDAVGGDTQQVLVLEPHCPPRGVVDAADDVEQRGLPGAVRPDQPANLAAVDREGEVVESDDPSEPH